MKYFVLFILNLYFHKDRNEKVNVTTTQHGAPLLASVLPSHWDVTCHPTASL